MSKKPTISGSGLVADVAAFQGLLAAAYAGNWTADSTGRPIVPLSVPTSLPGAAKVAPTAPPVGHVAPMAPTPLALPGLSTGDTRPRDVRSLVEWAISRHQNRHKKHGGKRSRGTNRGYADSLHFFLDLAHYADGDPRRLQAGAEPGAPWRVNDRTFGVCEQDLLRILELRASTNLRVRRSNQVAMEKWGREIEAMQHAEVTGNTPRELPLPPELAPEVASGRTVEAFARTVREMFSDAFAHGLIDYQPWTARVQEEVPYATTTSYHRRIVPSREQVDVIRRAMNQVTLTARTLDGSRAACRGDRYDAMVWVAGREGPRPEETIAVRDSWVVLDEADPRIELQWAEVFEPTDGKRRRIRVPLKHRGEGEIRVIRPEPEDAAEFIRVLSEHRRLFVTGSGQTGPAARDPYFFTNHHGDPIELSNFGRWWSAALASLPLEDQDPVFDGLPFRRLRAAAITDWLVNRGFNTAQVIEKHYKGVIDSRPDSARNRRQASGLPIPEDLSRIRSGARRAAGPHPRRDAAPAGVAACGTAALVGSPDGARHATNRFPPRRRLPRRSPRHRPPGGAACPRPVPLVDHAGATP